MKRWYISVVLCSLTLSPAAYAQVDRGNEFEDETQGPHESGATGPHLALPAERSAAGWVVLEGFTSIQVNVDENGMNVVGDAANEPSLAVDPTAPNRMVVGWRQFDSVESNFRQAGYSFSNDGGRTWAPMGVIEPGVFRSDPVVRADAHGTFFFLSLTTDGQGSYFTDLFTSHDWGQTWPIKSFAFGGDKQWLALDSRDDTQPTHLYQGWQSAANLWYPDKFSRSVDGGLSWQDPIDYDPIDLRRPDLGTLAVGPDGAVYSVGRDPTSIGIAIARSDDAQDPLVPVPTFEISQLDLSQGRFFVCICGTRTNPGGMIMQPQVVVDSSNGLRRGMVYIIAAAQRPFDGRQSTDLVLHRSEDRGQTWGDPIQVIPDVDTSTYRWFGTMSIAPNGRLDVVYNDTVNSPEDFEISETFYTNSPDGGDTWSDPAVLGPQWNSHVGWPRQNKIGDYYDMVSDDVGAHLIYATTYNGEQDVYYLRIGDYDCNANGIGDTIDIANGDAQDCNANGIPDSCEIAAGAEPDEDNNGVPDRCECPADLDRDLDIDSDDFFFYLDLFAAGDSGADVDGDGDVDGEDFTAFLELFAQGCP